MDDVLALSEPLDVFDEHFRHLGVKSRAEVHRSGGWHQTIHCWYARVEDDDVYLLLQLRQVTKQANPGKFDVSVAGHLLAGESAADGVRECEEELGVPVARENLSFVGTFRHVQVQEDLVDAEFCHVFVNRVSMSLREYQPVLDEIAGLYEIRMRDLEGLMASRRPEVVVTGFTCDATGVMADTRRLTAADMVSRPDDYLEALWHHLRVIQSAK